MENYQFCILSDEKDLIEYEKGLYEAFITKDPDGWLTNNYLIIDECRLKAQISYKYQKIYAVKNNNKIIAGGSINFNINNKLQLEYMGFYLTESQKKNKFCEALNFYIIGQVKGETFLEILSNFFDFMINDVIASKKIYISYGTCSDNLVNMYSLIGWEVLDNTIINGIKKFLIKYDAKKNLDIK